MANYKVPRAVELVDDLPRNATGKVVKDDLRQRGGPGPLRVADVSDPGSHGLSALSDLRVVELGVWVAAPSAAALLADWGAEVIKVESPTGDPMRNVFGSLGIGSDLPNPAFALDNRGKRSVVLDLREPGRTAGASRSSWPPPTSSSAISDPTPSTSSTSRPRRRSPGTRTWCTAASAATASEARTATARPTTSAPSGPGRGSRCQMADESGNPLNARGGIGDHITGLAALSGILAAVLEQRQTGIGRVVEVSLLRTGAYVLGWDLGLQMLLGKVSPAESRHHNQSPLMNPYRAADGRWFFFTGLEADRHIGAVARALGRARPAGGRAVLQRLGHPQEPDRVHRPPGRDHRRAAAGRVGGAVRPRRRVVGAGADAGRGRRGPAAAGQRRLRRGGGRCGAIGQRSGDLLRRDTGGSPSASPSWVRTTTRCWPSWTLAPAAHAADQGSAPSHRPVGEGDLSRRPVPGRAGPGR